MKTCGIIVEYNPLHAGHLHHLQQARQVSGCSVLVVVLSSYFTQRALPSLIEPYQKAALRLEHGADIVVELPAVYAAQSADRFARNAIDTLRNLHVDGVCFGSETNDIDELERQLAALNALEANPGTSWQKTSAPASGPTIFLACSIFVTRGKPASRLCAFSATIGSKAPPKRATTFFPVPKTNG